MQKSVAGRIAQFFNTLTPADLDIYFAHQSGKPTDVIDWVTVSNLEEIIRTSPGAPSQLKETFTNT